jgi:hypothetical protein
VEHKQHPQKHERVADAPDVGARPAVGDGEDVAEERHASALDEVRVRELAGPHVEPGRLKRAPRRRHHASVRHDRDQVQQPAKRDHPDEPQVQVPQHARACQRVSEEVRRPMKGLVALGRHGHDQDLDREGQRREPDPADPHLLEAPQPSARHRDGHKQQAEG